MSAQDFPHVFRGYDPATVDQHLAQLHHAYETAAQDSEAARHQVAAAGAELASAREAHEALTAELDTWRRRAHDLEEAVRHTLEPSYAHLGERIGTILGLADEEALEIRSAAARESDEVRTVAAQEADRVRADADRYAEQTRSRADLDAAAVLERARAEAESIVDDADRAAAIRREEAEAYFEKHRATVARQAAEFEAKLTERRDGAAAEFTAQLSKNEEHLAHVLSRAEQLSREASEAHARQSAQAQRLLEEARAEAASVVAAAREQAERIRRDSERELAAATARRDSITAQLSNVRSMLTTLGGPQVPLGLPDADEDAALEADDGDGAASVLDGSGSQTPDDHPTGADTADAAATNEGADVVDGAETTGAETTGAETTGTETTGTETTGTEATGAETTTAEAGGSDGPGSETIVLPAVDETVELQAVPHLDTRKAGRSRTNGSTTETSEAVNAPA